MKLILTRLHYFTADMKPVHEYDVLDLKATTKEEAELEINSIYYVWEPVLLIGQESYRVIKLEYQTGYYLEPLDVRSYKDCP